MNMIRRLIPYFKGYGKQALLAPSLITAETICELILPLLMAQIIDVGIANSDMGVILRMGALMLLVACISMTCGTLSAKFAAEASIGLGANLRSAEFDQVSKFSFADIDHFSSSSLITRMTNDITNIQNTVAMALRMLVRSLMMMVVALIVSFTIEWRLAIILLIILPILAAAVGFIMTKCHSLFRAMQAKIDALNEKVQENLVGIRVVKSYVRADFEKEKFRTANDEYTSAGLRAVLRVISLNPIMMLCVSTATVLILYNGGLLVLGGELPIGQLSSLLNYIMMVLMGVMMVAMTLLQYSRAQACSDRIFEVIDTEPDIEDGPLSHEQLPQSAGKVEFRNVAFKYTKTGTGDDVLTKLDFVAQPGQIVAIVGGTGVGKSSLVNLIPRFYDVSGGEVLLDDVNVKDYPLEDLRGRIGMVLQNNVLFSGTIRENLLWGDPNATEEEMIQAAKDAQAYDFIMSFPYGFDTHLSQGGVNVSGGQKQRLCIARAMLRKPSVLILDDSTSAVDSATEALIRESFYHNLKNTTVILIAQRISSVRNADQIIVLDEGTIAGIGTHEELMRCNKIYQEIYHSQLEGGVDHG
ncbi:MAG: ABC transporter ATP-binding protein/permease [Clostridiales bacterium]|nr:ABC transporter ATP-binding protein/permease [Clostridiales bacterium]